jgi:hypothetical protein
MTRRMWVALLGVVLAFGLVVAFAPVPGGRCRPWPRCNEASGPLPRPSPSTKPTTTPGPELEPLVAGLAGRDRRDPAAVVDSWNPRASWAELQPHGEGTAIVHPNAIDVALQEAAATGEQIRLRLDTGYRSPAWLKASVGTVSVCDPPGGGSPMSIGCFTVPRWWRGGWRSAHDTFLRELAADYDGQVALFHACSVATIFCEPFLRQVDGSSSHAQRNRTRLEAAGFSTAGDRASWYAAIDSWGRHFTSSRVAIGLNPGQGFDPETGAWTVGKVAYTRQIADHFVTVLGPRAVLQNNSLNEHHASGGNYRRLYSYMASLRDAGTPIAFQTSVAAYISDLRAVMELAIGYGAHLVELPAGWRNSGVAPAQWRAYRSRLLAQA